MAFKMGFSREEISGPVPVPAGWYTLQIKCFRPKVSKDKESVSFNAELAIINNPEYENRRVFVGLNTKGGWIFPDFVHATGLQMEVVQDGNEGTEKEQLALPGVFEGSVTHPDDPSQWKYEGSLTNATMEAELAEIPASAQYKAKNEVRQFKCAVAGCTDKHSTNLIKN